MDERLQYEQLIGSKLQSLPIPNIEDAIWARVKAQLDIDLPSDENNSEDEPQSPKGPGIVGWGLSLLIIALVSTFLVLKNKPTVEDKSVPSTTREQLNSPSVQNTGPPPSSDNTTKRTPAANNKGSGSVPPPAFDSPDRRLVTTPIDLGMDSSNTKLTVPLVLAPPQKTGSVTQVKRGKGMKNLNDSDYRIVPKNKN